MDAKWVSSTGTTVPLNAVFAGNDINGSRIYVGQSFHEGDLLPAKVIPETANTHVCFNGKEIRKHDYKILTGTKFTWISSSHGNVPINAFPGGNTRTGETLYIGRVQHGNTLMPGKIHKSHGCLYYPSGGLEHRAVQYEVLCTVEGSRWVQTNARAKCPPGAHIGGKDVDGSTIYIGRAIHEGDQIPAKVIPSKKVAFITYDSQEIRKEHFEILCQGNVHWVKSAIIPSNAVIGGWTSSGETLYIGRANFMGSLSVGKIHSSQKILYFAFGGAEVSMKSYEILVEN